MNAKNYVKISNVIGLVSIVLLVIWVFSYILIEVFDLLIFRENMTETFMMSVMALIAVLAGSLFVNVMFNLTRIADKHNADDETKNISKKSIFALLAVFPVLGILLFVGNSMTESKKENFMVESTRSFLNQSETFKLLLDDTKFDEDWVDDLARELRKFDTREYNFDNPSIIFSLKIEGWDQYYKVKDYNRYSAEEIKDTIPIRLADYRYYTPKSDADFYNKVFKEGYKGYRFTRSGKNFTLEYPFTYKNKTVIIQTQDYQQYGKYGS